MQISALGDNLLVEIFKNLTYQDICLGIRLTNKHWNKLSHDYMLWKVIKLARTNDNKNVINDEFFLSLMTNSSVVHKINVLNCSELSDKSFSYIAKHCPNLISLNVAYTSINDKALTSLITKCTKLEHINILGCRKLSPSILHRFSGLVKLHLRVDAFYTNIGSMKNCNVNLKQVAERCPHLEFFDARNSAFLSDNTVVEFATKCPKLRCMKLGLCVSLSDKCIKEMSTKLTNLKWVSLANCRIGDDAITALAENSPHLTHLIIAATNQKKTTDASLISIAMYCTELQYLDIQTAEHLQSSQYISDVGVSAVASNCLKLRHLNLSCCSKVTNSSLLKLAEKCQLLEYLEMRSSSSITSPGLNTVLQNCARLRYLDVQKCQGIQQVFLDERYNAVNVEGTVGFINGTKSIKIIQREEEVLADELGYLSSEEEEVREKHDDEEVSEKRSKQKECLECDPDDSGFAEMLSSGMCTGDSGGEEEADQDNEDRNPVAMQHACDDVANDEDVQIDFTKYFNDNGYGACCSSSSSVAMTTTEDEVYLGATPMTDVEFLRNFGSQSKTIHKIEYNARSLPMQLQYLDLSYCSKLSDGSLIQIGNHCHHLKSLNLKELPLITDSGVSHVIQNSPYLESIDVSCWQTTMSKVTDFTLSKLAQCCPELQSVLVWGAVGVSDFGVKEIFESCRKLRALGVTVGHQSCLDTEKVVAMVEQYHTLVKCKVHDEYFHDNRSRFLRNVGGRRQNIFIKL
ncbi:uncharacterized protein LOC144436158 [Glandiceps talaboti]